MIELMFKVFFFYFSLDKFNLRSLKISSVDVKKCKNRCVYSDYYVDLFNRLVFIHET